MSEWPDNQEAVCPVCGSPLAEGAQFCGECGSHVPSPLIPYDAPTTPDGIPSESVSPTVPGTSRFAIESATRCTACGTVNLPGAERCAVCGALLPDESADTLWPTEPGRTGGQP